ncbi:hypothetical protein [Roseateles amylovorans]|uniref:Uncharacterized protein n=1 Tax=Roseateles amylovorans TaxID=2978473 RepID=A0ABY6ATE1_9BURK|nr:hypothetical protein [Roseateles amylovorans]UXH76499.1 hypothetical protein N4261_15750 [Roseateles amylovorans]
MSPPSASPARQVDASSPLHPGSDAFRSWAGVLVLLMVLAMPVACYRAMAAGHHALAWIGAMALLVAVAALVGRGTLGLWRGVLIDERNLMSLSRFQLLLWSVLILSGFLAATLYNVFIGSDDPLAVAIPTELWMLMGVSTTSMVGSPLLLGQKAQKDTVAAHVEQVKQQVVADGGDRRDVVAQGQLMTNARPQQAQWTDMFTGEEAGNWFHVDMAQLQMFFFTLAIAMAYASVLCQLLVTPPAGGLHQLPPIDASAVALLSISHAGFLANKAVPRLGAASTDQIAA